MRAARLRAMDHQADVEALDRHYTAALAAHGDAAEAVQWSSRETQEARLAVLVEALSPEALRTASILDFGCGNGHLLRWLRTTRGWEGAYTGYDISAAMVDAARDLHRDDPDARFERRDILSEGIDGRFDLVLVSGTFNNALPDNWSFTTRLLRPLFEHADVALAFNAISTYVDYTTEGLAHHEPEALFRWCKTELSPRVALRHDYEVKPGVIGFEFSIYVYRTPVAPVPSVPGVAP